MTVSRANPREFGDPAKNGYCHVTQVSGGKLVYVAGQIARDDQDRLVGEGDLIAQAERIYERIGIALAAFGATFDDVVKMTTFVVDLKPEHVAQLAAVRLKFFRADRLPAGTMVGIGALAFPGYLIEIEAIAAVP